MAKSWWLSLLDGESPIYITLQQLTPNSAPHFLSQAWQWAHSSSHPRGCPLKGTFPWHRPKPEKNGPQRQRLGCRVWGESVGFAEWWLFCRKCKIRWYFIHHNDGNMFFDVLTTHQLIRSGILVQSCDLFRNWKPCSHTKQMTPIVRGVVFA